MIDPKSMQLATGIAKDLAEGKPVINSAQDLIAHLRELELAKSLARLKASE